ncbi:hypothetical protein M8C21_002291 [Ambrosia artemisiifolia]|uniref:Calcineurin-like phosphoesterase domain-containing protein n=1 Tax=Ambrosia artemisiifolia TaxID=4212 RepID=A0AAD5GLJ9_AMBAR|nr:hypothetical protein M8C21_002291 [Ambrosia artemisiifolia]
MESLVGQSRARRLDASPIKTQQGPQEYNLHQLLEIRKLTAVLSVEGKRRWEYGNTVRETIIANVPVVHNHKNSVIHQHPISFNYGESTEDHRLVISVNTQRVQSSYSNSDGIQQLRFNKKKGEFRILQVADMHYANGRKTACEDMLPEQYAYCSDLNTTFFIERMIHAEKPDLIVFTGDNIYGPDTTDPVASMNAAFAPAISSNIPWAAVLGNHDQESTLSREGVMKNIVGMKHTLSQLNPFSVDVIDGFGNYNLEVLGTEGSSYGNESILNLYFLDSGDYSTVPSIPGYGWIKPSQQFWFQQTSINLQKKSKAPGLAYFHIPLPEYSSFDSSNFTGVKQEGISSASVNSGFFTTLVGAGDVKAVFTGHDHINDFCGELTGIYLCYAGGFGYHAYGKAGWSRRSRVVVVSLEKKSNGSWGGVEFIKTYKRLDEENLTVIDNQLVTAQRIQTLSLGKGPIPWIAEYRFQSRTASFDEKKKRQTVKMKKLSRLVIPCIVLSGFMNMVAIMKPMMVKTISRDRNSSGVRLIFIKTSLDQARAHLSSIKHHLTLKTPTRNAPS